MKNQKKKRESIFLLVFLVTLPPSLGRQTSDYAPYFYDNGPSSTNGNMALFSISEDTPVGTQVYTLNGTDPEGDAVWFGLTFEKGTREYLRVDPKSGNITLIQELDREKQGEISALVSITDGRNKVVETIRVFVTDVNDEQPEFQNLPFTVDVPEDTAAGSSIYRVQAVDKDMGSGGSVTYYVQGTPTTKFTIDGHSGVLRIKPGETLDFETTALHFVTVVAKDGGGQYKGKAQVLTSTATITINVLDAQDTPPSFIGTPYFGYVYEVSVPGSEISTVFAKDGDEGNPNPIHYSITNGSEGAFTINSTSGCISLTAYPVTLRNELYEIKVKATELGPSEELLDYYTMTVVTVRVVDLNNHPPTFYGENGPQSQFEVTMHEHPSEGEILRGLKITVNDSDQGANAKFKLRLVGPGRVLRVVPQTVLNEAQVTIIVEDSAAIDYEKGKSLTYKLLAVEIDTPERFSATADIVIHLLDTNDNTPRFTSEYYITRIPENSPGGSNVVSVTANDPDSGLWGEVKYSIYGSGSDLFLIHPSSGIIYTQAWATLDAEVKSKYNFYVKAEDTEGKYSLAEVFVTVLDVNDHVPEFDDSLVERTMIIGAPVRVEAIDADAESPNNVIEYSIMQAEPDNIFDINAETGEIKLKSYIKSMEIVQNITEQKDCRWSLVVQARDRGSPSFSTTAVVKIDITEATQLKGPMAAFLLQSRDNPMKALGMVAGVVSILVGVTVLISTAMFLRNTKSNRIMPARRIIIRRRPPKDRKPWTFNVPFSGGGGNDLLNKTVVDDPEAGNVSINPNKNGRPRCSRSKPKPLPPRAPCLPPPSCPLPSSNPRPSERPRAAVPTVSGALASKSTSRDSNISSETTRIPVSSALVSELKMRLQQKIIESNSSYY
ncbi:cadherin-related family member 1-like isoform X1 [Coregonus clupeaformis]|uniref:cadherin-related family member 1-like isoform X1 n=1 Tax=Coregonus clupeaformis TaxID=59861 RepID=UPI001BDFCA6E|nr:cadherin-related family member 1-like isoform X1 [Coregonus clupeaformis]